MESVLPSKKMLVSIIAAGVSVVCITGSAQTITHSPRAWKKSAEGGRSIQVEQNQTAYFQAQGSLSDALPPAPGIGAMPNQSSQASLPQLPNFPAPSGNSTGAPAVLPGLSPSANGPAMPTGLPGHNSTPSNSSAPSRMGLPGLPSGVPNNANARGNGAVQNDFGPSSNSITPASSGLGLDQRLGGTQQVPVQTVGNRSTTPAILPSSTRSLTATSAAQGAGENVGLRDIDRPIGNSNNMATLPNRIDANQVVTGAPFVSPPPGQRYPTRPISQPFQLTAYQQPALATQPGSAPVGLPQYAQPVFVPTAYQCPAPVGQVPTAITPPTYTQNWTPNLYTPNNGGYRPLFSLGQENYNVMLGRGIIGQPTVYVSGQPLRNFLRYISP